MKFRIKFSEYELFTSFFKGKNLQNKNEGIEEEIE
jgi:hypothetical protein